MAHRSIGKQLTYFDITIFYLNIRENYSIYSQQYFPLKSYTYSLSVRTKCNKDKYLGQGNQI